MLASASPDLLVHLLVALGIDGYLHAKRDLINANSQGDWATAVLANCIVAMNSDQAKAVEEQILAYQLQKQGTFANFSAVSHVWVCLMKDLPPVTSFDPHTCQLVYRSKL